MWHVSSRSGVATLRTAIHLLLTYLLWVRLDGKQTSAKRRNKPAAWSHDAAVVRASAGVCVVRETKVVTHLMSQCRRYRTNQRTVILDNTNRHWRLIYRM